MTINEFEKAKELWARHDELKDNVEMVAEAKKVYSQYPSSTMCHIIMRMAGGTKTLAINVTNDLLQDVLDMLHFRLLNDFEKTRNEIKEL